MSKTEATTRVGIEHAINLVFFEQWLRFYFITEEEGELYIRMPNEAYQALAAQNPDMLSMAQALNNKIINHQAALTALCDNMLSGDYALNASEWAQVLGGNDFQLLLQLLGFWVQAEEDELDAKQLPFNEWKERFMLWKETEAVKDYAGRLKSSNVTPEDSFPHTLQ